jgi:hypothetical protein
MTSADRVQTPQSERSEADRLVAISGVRALNAYVAELHVPADARGDLARLLARAGTAAAELAREGVPVRYLSAIYLPWDETLLALYDGPSASAVGNAVARARLRWERVLDAETHP